MSEYNSSEELQRQNADVFASKEAKKEQAVTPDTERVIKVLDKYIRAYGSTKWVRAEAKKQNRTNDYQLDLSDGVIEILEKIRNELG